MNKGQQLRAQAKAQAEAAIAMLDLETVDMKAVGEIQAKADNLLVQAEAWEKAHAVVDTVSALVLPAPLPIKSDDPGDPLTVTPQDMEDAATNAVKAAYITRFGSEEEAIKGIMRDLHGADYRQKRLDQWRGFCKYLRTGEMDREGNSHMMTPAIIKMALSEGLDVGKMKATMVEASDELGGYAVPEDFRAEVIARQAAMTVVRQNGARVITTSREVVELPVATGGDSQYRDAVRVTWVEETPTAGTADTNLTLGMERVIIYTVMAETFLSQNLVEDAAFNLVEWLTQSFASAQAVDEDNKFIVGSGTGEPYGILPGGANAHGLGVVVTGDANEIKADGIISLVYEIDDQYMNNAIFIGRKTTFREIRKLKDGNGRYIWEPNYQPGEPPTILGHVRRGQESMPTVSAGTYPLIFGDLSGYTIADRIGMSVKRFDDSAVARENKVLYLVKRRLGAHLTEPWKFKVQKVSA